jgi:hypothetical protein
MRAVDTWDVGVSGGGDSEMCTSGLSDWTEGKVFIQRFENVRNRAKLMTIATKCPT